MQAAAMRERAGLMSLLLIVAVTVALALLPYFASLPPPADALPIKEAQFGIEGEGAQAAVSLPHSWTPADPYDLAVGVYRFTFIADGPADKPLFIFVPEARHQLEAWVNGHRTLSALDTAWSSPISGYAFLSRIPEAAVHQGENDILLRQTREIGWLPGRLSEVYVGPATAVMPSYRLSNFVIEQIRAMTFALHIVLAIGIVTIWGARRHDPVFGWLALIAIASLFVIAMQSPLMALGDIGLQFQSMAAVSGVGLMAVGVALALARRSRPRALIWSIAIVPLTLLLAGQLNWLPFAAVGLVSGLVALVAYAAAAIILFSAFLERRNWDAVIMAVPCALTCWFGLHDILVVTGLSNEPFLLVSYVRTLMLLAIMVLLMRRLARSLNGLDAANETLRLRLARQEHELTLLHEKERARAGELVREQERHRLMEDLHDGLSGHLVSIIALTENTRTDHAVIENTAREALDDLRLVIQSLDIDDHDLLVALAGFRERLVPQLRRLHVKLDWSADGMPEIGGVTPDNALTVLRILQEAVTNAIKHGPATRIGIKASGTPCGARIVVENDCRGNAPAGAGRGLANMRRRAEAIGAEVTFEREATVARIVLLLPRELGHARR
jgi:signal transduction histidine kinase